MGNSNFIYEPRRRALYGISSGESGKVYAGRRAQQQWIGNSCELLCGTIFSTYSNICYKYTCIIGEGTKILSYRQTNGSEEAYYETKWLLGANIKQRKTECTRDEALMNGCVGCLNTLQIKAVAMPRSGEHQQVAAAVAL